MEYLFFFPFYIIHIVQQNFHKNELGKKKNLSEDVGIRSVEMFIELIFFHLIK